MKLSEALQQVIHEMQRYAVGNEPVKLQPRSSAPISLAMYNALFPPKDVCVECGEDAGTNTQCRLCVVHGGHCRACDDCTGGVCALHWDPSYKEIEER